MNPKLADCNAPLIFLPHVFHDHASCRDRPKLSVDFPQFPLTSPPDSSINVQRPTVLDPVSASFMLIISKPCKFAFLNRQTDWLRSQQLILIWTFFLLSFTSYWLLITVLSNIISFSSFKGQHWLRCIKAASHTVFVHLAFQFLSFTS